MNTRSSSLQQRRSPLEGDDDELPPVLQSTELPVEPDSSSDDIPLRRRRPVRMPSNDRETSNNPCDHRQARNQVRKSNNASLLQRLRDAHQATLPSPPKPTVTLSGKVRKKPGPQPWASKPIKKNDLEAKKAVIREIEGFWGKGFTKTYIPKCHRPLVKRGKAGKRAMYRDHETDPKNWLPSVLKSMLGIAKLTQNKAWLKKAMNDVVRYRIKNTGNRKPQLVTTDFDILEDMLIKDWDVPYSFSIRYKHLLVNRQGQQETDEDIDHIFGPDSDGEDDLNGDAASEDEDAVVKTSRNEEGEKEGDDSEEEMSQGGLSGQYLHTSGYINATDYPLPYPVPGPPAAKQKSKKEKGFEYGTDLHSRSQSLSQNVKDHQIRSHPYPYGPLFDPWGRPLPYGVGPDGFGGYGGYGMYGGYGAYAPSADSTGRQGSQPARYYGMSPYHAYRSITPAPGHANADCTDRERSRDPSAGGNKCMRNDVEQPAFYAARPGFAPYGFPQDFQRWQLEVKEESPEAGLHGEGGEAVDEVEEPENEIGEDSNAAAVEAELRATELELKVARLQAARIQARRAASKQQSSTQ